MKSSFPTVPLSDIDASKMSVYDLKQRYASSASVPAAKVKLLYKKKPVADSKTVAEVVGSDVAGEVEFGVMVMGGAVSSSAGEAPVQSPPAVAPTEAEKGLGSGSGSVSEYTKTPSAAVGPSGKELVAADEFWSDLKTFVLQRIKDEAEGERLVGIFKTAWENDK